MNEYKVSFSREAKKGWLRRLILIVFVCYFLLVRFFEDYFYLGEEISGVFFIGVIVLTAALWFIILFTNQLFKKTALTISDSGVTVGYYLTFKNFYIPFSKIEDVSIKLKKGQPYIVFELDTSNVELKPMHRFLSKFLKKETINSMMMRGEALNINPKELVEKIKAIMSNPNEAKLK